MKKENPEKSEIILYKTEDGRTALQVKFEGETVWLTQQQLAELFQTTVPNISMHIRNLFAEKELLASATVKKLLTVQNEGKRQISRNLEHYNLDVIISVGYRVRSHRGTQFRVWATELLREYVIKGFAMDDERLKNPPGPGALDHFDELLERIRDIRASERRMYLRVREIFALAADYEPSTAETQNFFQVIQNKLHFSVTGKTAPELISARVLFVGPCPDSQYLQKIKILQNHAPSWIDIQFLGQIENSAMLASLYSRAKLFWFASKKEGMGNVVAEALVYGTPVVTLPVMGIMESLFSDSEDGEIVKTQDPQKFAQVASSWLKRDVDRLAISKRARERFNTESVDAQYLTRFKAITGNGLTGPP